MLYSIHSIAPIASELHAAGRKLVLATGFFDLLHEEHQNFLAKAKATGDILIVAVESDARARAIKGEGRPVESQAVRCAHLLNLTCKRASVASVGSELSAVRSEAKDSSEPCVPLVDYVITLPDDFDHFEAYDALMAAVRPDVYAVSSHSEHLKSKTFLTEKYGGKLVVVHEHNPAVSTTQIINSQNHV